MERTPTYSAAECLGTSRDSRVLNAGGDKQPVYADVGAPGVHGSSVVPKAGKNSKPPGKQRLSIRGIVIITCVLCVVGAAAFSWVVTFMLGLRNVEDVAHLFMHKVSIEALNSIHGYFGNPMFAAKGGRNRLETAALRPENWRELFEFCHRSVAAVDGMTGLFISYLGRNSSDTVYGSRTCPVTPTGSTACQSPWVYAFNGTHTTTWAASDRGQPTIFSATRAGYAKHPDKEGCVAAALASAEKTQWCNVFMDDAPESDPIHRLSVTYSRAFKSLPAPSDFATYVPAGVPNVPETRGISPMADNAKGLDAPYIGTISITLSLAKLSDLLATAWDAREGESAEVNFKLAGGFSMLVEEGTGHMIATSGDPSLVVDRAGRLLRASESGDGMVKAIISAYPLGGDGGDDGLVQEMGIGGRAYLAVHEHVDFEPNLRWRLYTAVPKDAILQQLRTSIIIVSICNAVWLLLAVVGAVYVAVLITKPLDRVYRQMRTFVDELGVLTAEMTGHIRASNAGPAGSGSGRRGGPGPADSAGRAGGAAASSQVSILMGGGGGAGSKATPAPSRRGSWSDWRGLGRRLRESLPRPASKAPRKEEEEEEEEEELPEPDYGSPASTTRSGSARYALAELSRFQPVVRDIRRGFLSFSDVVSREAAARMELRIRAESSHKFLQTVSHEMRTPLNGIMGMIDLTLDLEIPPEAQENLQSALRCSEHLLFLVNDILDFQRIEAGQLELRRVPFCVDDVVEGAARITQLKAQEKGLLMEVEIDAAIPAALEGDPDRLRQALINLVNNACKYSFQGTIRVTVRAEPPPGGDTPGTLTLYFEVSDEGVGIDEEGQRQLFTRFYRAPLELGGRPDPGGTGLGLAITKQIVEQSGGTIGCRSAPGAGSRFFFSVPFRIPPPNSGEPLVRRSRQGSVTSSHLLPPQSRRGSFGEARHPSSSIGALSVPSAGSGGGVGGLAGLSGGLGLPSPVTRSSAAAAAGAGAGAGARGSGGRPHGLQRTFSGRHSPGTLALAGAGARFVSSPHGVGFVAVAHADDGAGGGGGGGAGPSSPSLLAAPPLLFLPPPGPTASHSPRLQIALDAPPHRRRRSDPSPRHAPPGGAARGGRRRSDPPPGHAAPPTAADGDAASSGDTASACDAEEDMEGHSGLHSPAAEADAQPRGAARLSSLLEAEAESATADASNGGGGGEDGGGGEQPATRLKLEAPTESDQRGSRRPSRASIRSDDSFVPLAAAAGASPAPARSRHGSFSSAASAAAPAAAPLQILVVDDNDMNRKVLCAFLAKEGHATATARDGEEAVAAFEARAREATRRIRELERALGLGPAARTPVVACTAFTAEADRAAALAAGMDGHIGKPVTRAVLLPVLRQWGAPAPAPAAAEAGPGQAAPPPAASGERSPRPPAAEDGGPQPVPAPAAPSLNAARAGEPSPQRAPVSASRPAGAPAGLEEGTAWGYPSGLLHAPSAGGPSRRASVASSVASAASEGAEGSTGDLGDAAAGARKTRSLRVLGSDAGASPAPPRSRHGSFSSAASAAAPAAAPLQILVVDDNDMNRKVLCAFLAKEGHATATARDGEEAVAAFEARARAAAAGGGVRAAFDLVFMDIAMPRMDGMEATRRIRELERALGLGPVARTPVVACTAFTAEADRAAALAAGMDGHIGKPVTRAVLLPVLRQWGAPAPSLATEAGPGKVAPPPAASGERSPRAGAAAAALGPAAAPAALPSVHEAAEEPSPAPLEVGHTAAAPPPGSLLAPPAAPRARRASFAVVPVPSTTGDASEGAKQRPWSLDAFELVPPADNAPGAPQLLPLSSASTASGSA
eukprot:tig00020603_g11807.t1